jgi:transcriptional regulator with XRE-family HTH domain
MTDEIQALTTAIGQRLRAQRQALGLSLSELSKRTGGLSKSRISNYEQGIRRMGVEEAEQIATALGTVTPAFLLGFASPQPVSPQEHELLEAYRRLDPEIQAMIRRALRVPVAGR